MEDGRRSDNQHLFTDRASLCGDFYYCKYCRDVGKNLDPPGRVCRAVCTNIRIKQTCSFVQSPSGIYPSTMSLAVEDRARSNPSLGLGLDCCYPAEDISCGLT